jgi:hypothetical protein
VPSTYVIVEFRSVGNAPTVDRLTIEVHDGTPQGLSGLPAFFGQPAKNAPPWRAAVNAVNGFSAMTSVIG